METPTPTPTPTSTPIPPQTPTPQQKKQPTTQMLYKQLYIVHSRYTKDTLVQTPNGPRFSQSSKIRAYRGVKDLVTTHRKNDINAWRRILATTDYTTIESRCESPSCSNNTNTSDNKIGRLHDNVLIGLHLSGALSKHGYKVLWTKEFPVGDPNVCVFTKKDAKAAIIGSIDMICEGPNGELVVAELKTLETYYDLSLEELFLKEEHAIQLEIYSFLLEFMSNATECGDIKIDHCLLIGYDGKNGVSGIWKIKRNPDKWIKGIGLEEHRTPIEMFIKLV
jgi:hypothetical protein